jgi:hypothetical protein
LVDEITDRNGVLSEVFRMNGPGEYTPDAAEGVTRVEDLPEPKKVLRQRSFKRRKCPQCGHSAYRDKTFTRTLHDLGDLAANRPRDLVVTYSQHCCSGCGHYFNADLSDLTTPGSHYTRRVVSLAVRLVVEDGLPYRSASWHLWRDHRVFVPFATIQNWVEAGGKKSRPMRHGGVSRRRAGRLLRLHRRR